MRTAYREIVARWPEERYARWLTIVGRYQFVEGWAWQDAERTAYLDVVEAERLNGGGWRVTSGGQDQSQNPDPDPDTHHPSPATIRVGFEPNPDPLPIVDEDAPTLICGGGAPQRPVWLPWIVAMRNLTRCERYHEVVSRIYQRKGGEPLHPPHTGPCGKCCPQWGTPPAGAPVVAAPAPQRPAWTEAPRALPRGPARPVAPRQQAAFAWGEP